MTTFKQVKEVAKELGFSVKKTGFGPEIRFVPKGESEEKAGYTDCPDDAISTMKMVAKQIKAFC